MLRLLRNLSINVTMSCVLVCFALFIGVVAALGVMASREADNSLQMLRQVNERQLNEINRADALLNGARINLEITLNYIMMGRMLDASDDVARVRAILERAEQHLENFIAAPKSEAAARLAGPLIDNFREMFGLAHEMGTAMIDLNTPGFTRLREQSVEPSQALAENINAFVEYANGRAASQLSYYEAQNQRFAWIGGVVLGITAIMLVLLYLVLRKVVVQPLGVAVNSLERISEADLSEEIRVQGRNEIAQLFAAMVKMQQSLTRIVGDVRQGSNSIHVGTREIASGNADLSSRTEQQAASLEETATSMEELTATVRQNADNARQASSVAVDASTTASRGGEVVERVITTMHGISGSSQKISDIIGVIDSIAFQTNILALNASVEAARAGDQGRGFAVVAGEVRNLAGRSAEAAREIKELIEGSVAQVQDGSVLVEQAGETMREVVAAVKRVTDIMDEISAASQEQSGGIEQISQAVSQMDEVTQQNAALVQQAAAAAVSLEEQADRLEQAMAVFRLPGEQATALPASGPDVSGPAGRYQSPVQQPPAQLTRSASVATNSSVATRQHSRREAVVEDDWEEF